MKTRIISAVAGIAALVLSGSLMAQGMGGGGGGGGAPAGGAPAAGEPVNRCVADFSGNLPNSFAGADKNGDGKVDRAELAEYVAGGQLDTLLGRWDKDGDGFLNEQEYCFR